MTAHSERFVAHLIRLGEQDRGALAILRRSVGFAPGAYPRAYPYVERFVDVARVESDPYRLALYVVSGLYALHPKQSSQCSFAAAMGALRRARESDSVEKRFIALLSAGHDELPNYLRQTVSLLAADGLAFDYIKLLDDLARWLNPYAIEVRDVMRRRWARDFYRVPIDQSAGDDPSIQSARSA